MMTGNLSYAMVSVFSRDADEVLLDHPTDCRATESLLALMGDRQRLADQGGVPCQYVPRTVLPGDTDGPAR